MLLDVQNELSSAQAFTGAKTVSTNSYKKQSAAQDISIGRRIAVLVYVSVAAGAGSTHTFDAIQSTAADLGSSVDVLSTVTALAAALTAGTFVEIPIPQGVITKQYLGYQNTSTGGTTTVTCSAWLVPQDEIAKYKSFPKAVDAQV